MRERQQNSANYPIPFLLVSSTDHITGVANLSPTVQINKLDGNGWATPTGAVTGLGNGWYQLAGNATDRATLGTLLIRATGTGVDPADLAITIVPWDPFAAAFGLQYDASGYAKLSSGSGTGQLTLTSGAVNLSPTGLDAIPLTAPSGAATTFTQALVMVYRRFFKKTVRNATANTITCYADNGTTAITTQTISDDGAGNQTLGNA